MKSRNMYSGSLRWSGKAGHNGALPFLSHGHSSQTDQTAHLECGLPHRSPAPGYREPLDAGGGPRAELGPKLRYKWQQAAPTPVAAAAGASLDPATAAEWRQLRAANRRRAQELEILKEAIASFSAISDQ